MSDMPELFGDELDAKVTWKTAEFSHLVGRPVRLRFALRDGDLFALRTN